MRANPKLLVNAFARGHSPTWDNFILAPEKHNMIENTHKINEFGENIPYSLRIVLFLLYKDIIITAFCGRNFRYNGRYCR